MEICGCCMMSIRQSVIVDLPSVVSPMCVEKGEASSVFLTNLCHRKDQQIAFVGQ